jgi:hypothetical protein
VVVPNVPPPKLNPPPPPRAVEVVVAPVNANATNYENYSAKKQNVDKCQRF